MNGAWTTIEERSGKISKNNFYYQTLSSYLYQWYIYNSTLFVDYRTKMIDRDFHVAIVYILYIVCKYINMQLLHCSLHDAGTEYLKYWIVNKNVTSIIRNR